MLSLHQCFHSSDSGLPVRLQPWPGGQVSTGGAKQPPGYSLPAASGLSAQLHFHSVKYSTEKIIFRDHGRSPLLLLQAEPTCFARPVVVI